MNELIDAVEKSREEYEKYPSFFPKRINYLTSGSRDYLPELARARVQREATLERKKDESMSLLMKDLAVDRERNPRMAALDRWDPDEEDEEDGGDTNII